MKENWSLFRPRLGCRFDISLATNSRACKSLTWHSICWYSIRINVENIEKVANAAPINVNVNVWRSLTVDVITNKAGKRITKQTEELFAPIVLSQRWNGTNGVGGLTSTYWFISLFCTDKSLNNQLLLQNREKRQKLAKTLMKTRWTTNITSYTASPLFLTSSLPDIFGAILNLNGNHWLQPRVAYWLHIS